ncbi:MAG TPA: polymer-forming cytoskeletal protein [Chthoniobacterales bacterium]|nr:polymer-forming cytoskeletal protein [Chthoniobacterales bacterium]
MEYVAAKTTICRQCGRSFSPSAPKPGLKLKDDSTAAPEEVRLHKKLEGIWNRQRNRLVSCFECKRKHEVSDQATSTNCPGCSAHIDLRDYKITTSFSRTIRTRGDLHLSNKGDLSSTSVICRCAVVEGKLRGNLECEDSMTINLVGKIPGRIAAQNIIVERKSEIQCFRRVRATNIDIKGRMSGEIIATGAVTIRKGGSLEGNVTAKSIAIEKGGLFSGQLMIGQANLTQGELLPDAKAPEKKKESDVPLGGAQPAHAT